MPRYYTRPTLATTSTGGGGGTIINANFTNPEFVARSRLPLSQNAVTVTLGPGYFQFVGLWPIGSVWNHWEGNLTVIASNQSGEMGIFVSPDAPKRQAQALTPIATTTLYDSITAGVGTKRNTNAFNATLYTDSYLWVGIRHSGAGTQPTWSANALDLGDAYVLIDPTSTAFTSTNTFFATLYTAPVPYMAASMI